MSSSTPRSAEVGSFLVRLALCPVLVVLGILLLLVYPSGQNGTSQPGNGTTIVSLPFHVNFNRTHPEAFNSTVSIRYLPINLDDPPAIMLAWVLPIATGIAYIIIQAQRVDETRKLESRSREDYHNRSWHTSFSQEMQEVCRNAGKADRVMAFLIFSTTGLCCVAAWTFRIIDGALGKTVPPSREQLEELSEESGGKLVLGAQSLPWNYTREAWVCGWKERVLDPAAASQFSTPCTRIQVSYFLVGAILLVVLMSLLSTVRPSYFDRESPATDQTVSIIRLRWKDLTGSFLDMKNKLKEGVNGWRDTWLGGWTRVVSDGEMDIEDEELERDRR